MLGPTPSAVYRPPTIASFDCLLHRARIIEQDPFGHRDWQTAILDQVIMELAEPEIFAALIFVSTEQIHDLPFADDVADFLRWA